MASKVGMCCAIAVLLTASACEKTKGKPSPAVDQASNAMTAATPVVQPAPVKTEPKAPPAAPADGGATRSPTRTRSGISISFDDDA